MTGKTLPATLQGSQRLAFGAGEDLGAAITRHRRLHGVGRLVLIRRDAARLPADFPG